MKTPIRVMVHRLFDENDRLRAELYGILPHVVNYTAERDIKAGETIQVRVPKPFIIDPKA